MKKSIILLIFLMILLPLFAQVSTLNREVGTWNGYVYNLETSFPVEDAIVYLSPHFPNSPAEYYNCWVDENGFFEFVDIVAAVYDVRVYKYFYLEYETTITINEGINDPTDYYLQRATGCNYSIYFIPDDYWYETTWSLYNEDEWYWYYEAWQDFDSGDSFREYVYLEPGNWSIHLWDSYGDGGGWFHIADIDGSLVIEGGCEGDHSEHAFYVPQIAGCDCTNPISYSDINDPAHMGECNGRQEIWYEFYLENTCTDVSVSLAGSNFDTRLEVWGDCSDNDYLYINDNWQSEEYSRIDIPSLDPGYYYARIYAQNDDESGYYNLEITGTPSSITGDLDGYVFDANNNNPVDDALVEIVLANQRDQERLSVTTDENGYFAFEELATTTYDITVTKTLYVDFEEQVTIQEGQNSVNIYLDPFVDWTAYISLTVDSWEQEASYNLWDSNNNSWWWDTDQTFADEYSTHDWWLDLPQGYYEIHCYDSYSDGGISGTIENFWGFTLNSWNATDYTAEGIFGFDIGSGVFYGDVDDNGSVEAYDAANVLQYTVEMEPDAVPLPWNDITQIRANVDGNEWIGAYDASLILMYVNDVISLFPVESMRTIPDYQAQITVSQINDQLVFSAIGELISFSAELPFPISEFQTDLMAAVNENKIALASDMPISGEFLSITAIDHPSEFIAIVNDLTEIIAIDPIPQSTKISSIYPNPFNPSTNITYELASDSDVLIRIFNIKGQIVDTIVDKFQHSGSYQVQWNATNLASGIYFAQFSSNDYIVNKKLILMK